MSDLILWLSHHFDKPIIEATSNDASNRKYYRLVSEKTAYVVMDSSKEKSSLKDFLKIHAVLKNSTIKIPKIYQQETNLGYLVLEDLGDTTFLNKQEPINIALYIKAIDDLILLQNIDTSSANIANYDSALLLNELSLFTKWYCIKHAKITLTAEKQVDISKAFNYLLDKISQHKMVLVHRDYHSRNMMLIEKNDKEEVNYQLAHIDFQDALIGSYAYDLCSLLKDAYVRLDPLDLDYLVCHYYKNSPINNHNNSCSYEEFLIDFDLISIQRQLKVLGIFARLSHQDNKHQYLKDMPLVVSYLLESLVKYPKLKIIHTLLQRTAL